MKQILDLGSGLVGAASVTLVNELAKRYLPESAATGFSWLTACNRRLQ